MNYTMTKPCDACPFLNTANNRRTFKMRRLMEFASGAFPCHKTAKIIEDEQGESEGFTAKANSQHCAGALIFCEKRNMPSQMMRIAERLGMYDRRKLDMKANVR